MKKMVKRAGLAADILMYLVLLGQMFYVFTGNLVHEWAGILFFAALAVHLWIKRRWFLSCLKRKQKLFSARRFADLMIVLLMVVLLLLAVSSMGVSRTLFVRLGLHIDPVYHRWLGTLALTLALVHGGMRGYFAAKNKKKAAICILLLAAGAIGIGAGLIPYMNRHWKVVAVKREDVLTGDSLSAQSDKTLVVYFTRLGNTDFEENVDAVSGASLMLVDGNRMGNTQFMADALETLLNCDKAAITLTGEKYPSSYLETCKVGGVELKNQARPEIEPTDTTAYDTVLLVYPIWWGTIPMPVASFLESASLDGKTIYLIATQGSSGFASSTKDVQSLAAEANVFEGISIYCDDIPKSRRMLENWLMESGIAE